MDRFPFHFLVKSPLIDSPSVILYLALQESQPLIAQLQALLDAGAAELLDGASYRMIGPFLYDRNTDLSLEADTGSALLI